MTSLPKSLVVPFYWLHGSDNFLATTSVNIIFSFLSKLMELKLTVDGLEKERDFYFSKLRDIELICQEHESENNPVLSRIINILYATEVSSHYTQQMQAALHHFYQQVLYSE